MRSRQPYLNKHLKPTYGSVQINYGHPLSKNLGYVYLANEGAGQIQDLVRKQVSDGFGVTITNPTWSVTAGGFGHTDTVWQVAPEPRLYNATDISVLVVLQDKTNTGVLLPLTGVFDGVITNFAAWRLWIDDADVAFNSFQFRLGATPTKVNTSAQTRLNGLHAYGFIVHGSTDVVYVRDGSYIETKAHAIALAGQSNCRAQVLGATAASTVRTVLTVMWPYALTVGQMQWATAEPYTFLKPKAPRVRYFQPTAAVTTTKKAPSLMLTGVGV